MAAFRRSLGARDGALVLIDIDGLIYYNDERAYIAGDQLLIAIADKLRNECADACCYRVAGDEFALLLLDTDLDAATDVAERVRATIEASFANMEPLSRTLRSGLSTPTVTCGVIAWTRRDRPVRQQPLDVVEGVLTVGKTHGGNCVAAADIDWRAGQVVRLEVGDHEQEVFRGAPLSVLIERADPLYFVWHRALPEAAA